MKDVLDMKRPLNRRAILSAGASAGLVGTLGPLIASRFGSAQAGALPSEPVAAAQAPSQSIVLGDKQPFSFATLKARAQALSKDPFLKSEPSDRVALEQIDYDSYQQIKFRPEASLKLDPGGRVPVQLFHPGRLFMEPVKVHIVGGEAAREVLYSPALFQTPSGHPARGLPQTTGFAGLRVMAADLKNDWLAFLGASYFRTSGPYNQYGLSARGLAISTGLPLAEEFPRFTAFWLEGGEPGRSALTIYALLDSPSVSGAYRFQTQRLTDSSDIHQVVMDVEAELYPRVDVARVGIAPFSSMFWYGEGSAKRGADWRPEIHDNDGLAIWTGAGERIWRPLQNPNRVMTATFVDRDVRGFGLLQRDRDFVHYLDDGVFYERRPSVWVEPLDNWGEGAVHLVEIPTDDETNDNIVAYWCPKDGLKAGKSARYRYRLSWLDDIAFPASLGRATATWTGLGGRPGFKRPDGVRKYVIDWQGQVFAGLGRTDGVEQVITASRGTVTNAYTHPVVDQRERWRSFFDIEATGPDPVDIRAYLKRNGTALSETWIGQYFPGE
jgi:periplasmic glucans biosynthesis protein